METIDWIRSDSLVARSGWGERFDEKWNTPAGKGGFFSGTSDARTRENVKNFIKELLK